MDEEMDKLEWRERIKKYGDNISVLEEEIDLKLQMQYFEASKAVKLTLDKANVLRERHMLFADGISLEQKKLLLSKLASVNEVEAFRTLEAYSRHPDALLMEWSILAYQESKMLLQSSLLDKSPLYISTGLGGKGTKLRYFVVVKTLDSKCFTELQRQIVTNELKYAFNDSNAELEDISFYSNFVTITGLVPLKIGLKTLFSTFIRNSNELGNFVDPSIIITNTRKLSVTEIEQAIEMQK